METKFTKGKWNFCSDGNVYAFLNNGGANKLFSTETKSIFLSEEEKANAHLIAAAPEMYEALEQVMTTLSSDGFGCFDNTCAEIGKLLAKARGEHD